MSVRFGVGIVGAGVISDTYLQNLTSFPDLAVRAITDLDPSKASSQAERYDLDVSGSLPQLLSRDDVDIVVNLTAPTVHVEVGMQAIAAGKHVWSEKPLGVHRAEARRLLEAAEAAGLRVACAPDTVLGEGIQSARRLLEDGRIGRPINALAQMLNPGPEQWHPSPEFLFQPGAGPVLDMGPYYLTTLVSLFGGISRVSATAQRSHETRVIGSGPRAGEQFSVNTATHVSALYEFSSGETAQAVFSFDSGVKRTALEVSGTHGTILLPDPNKFFGDAVVTSQSGQERIPSGDATATRGVGVVELAQAIHEERPERASGRLALHVLDAALATLEAAESGIPVQLSTTAQAPPLLPPGWNPRAGVLR